MSITVFARKDCVQSRATIDWLTTNNVVYTLVDTTIRPGLNQELQAAGYWNNPVIRVGTPGAVTSWDGHKTHLLEMYCKEIAA